MYFCQFISKFHFWNVSIFHKNSKRCDEAIGLALKLFATSTYCGDLAGPNEGNIVKKSSQVENAQETSSSHYISISRS